MDEKRKKKRREEEGFQCDGAERDIVQWWCRSGWTADWRGGGLGVLRLSDK